MKFDDLNKHMGVIGKITCLKNHHENTWRDRPDWRWYFSLFEEFVELGLSLIGLHKGPVEWELMQIASIAANWMERRG